MIISFEDTHIENACKISHFTWGDFYKKESERVQKVIYDFMIEYYDLNRDYSFSFVDDGYKGFILANEKTDKKVLSTTAFESLEEGDRVVAEDLLSCLESCGKSVKSEMTTDDIMVGLFVSTQKGGGKELLSALIDKCVRTGKKNLYLWSDTTCDYKYYAKNGFEVVKSFDKTVNGETITVLIYRKPIV
ncbi:hypothetical protein IJV79_02250 [bacterium]|nr:hypothetical protein [bacterium]